MKMYSKDEAEKVSDTLIDLADWFDNPNKSPAVTVTVFGTTVTPGYLLRRIADAVGLVEECNYDQ